MRTFTRRSFVHAAGAGIALAPLYLPARARGANDRIRLGFIGVGKMGAGHLKAFLKMPDVEVRAIADVEQTRRELAKKVVDDANTAEKREAVNVSLYVDYQEMLGRDEIDALVISTPDHWHAAPLVHAAQARKDVYCEKPLTLTLDESELVVKAVREHKIVMQTGSQQRSENDGRFRVAAAYVRAGRLGRITGISAHFGTTSKPCDLPEEPLEPGLDWDRWLGQAPARAFNKLLCQRGAPEGYPYLPGWRDYSEFSGGQVTDWGGHHLDIVQWALGMDAGGPSRILPPKGQWPAGGGGQLVYARTPVGDEIAVTHRTYGNGVRFQGTLGELWVNRGELTDNGGRLFRDKLSEAELNFDGHLAPAATVDWTGSDKGTPPKITGPNHRRDFLDRIRDRRDPICNVEVGAHSANACHLLNLAYWHGKAITWNAVRGAGVPATWKKRKARPGFELPKI